MRINVSGNTERKSERNGREKHFNANEEVLIARRNSAPADQLLSICIDNWVDGGCGAQDCEKKAFKICQNYINIAARNKYLAKMRGKSPISPSKT